MKSISLAGIVLMVLGLLALAYQGINYTHRETVLDVGPIHATADTEQHIPLPPIVGGLAILGGALLLFAGAEETSERNFSVGESWRTVLIGRAPPAHGVVSGALTKVPENAGSAAATLIREVNNDT